MAKKPADVPSDPIVLFVDDHPDTLELYELMFQHEPVRVRTAPSGLHALQILQNHASEIVEVVSDYTMPGMNGIDLLDIIAYRYPHIERVLLTGEVDSDIVVEAKRHKVLSKWFDSELIKRAILRRAKGRKGGAGDAP
jgi:DNA-binding NtrC family response regulator